MATQTTPPRVKSARDSSPNTEQTAQLVAWLDEEHRRDKAQLSEVLDQIGQHHTQIDGLAKSLQDAEERFARLQNQANRYALLEQSIAQIKSEVQMILAQYDEKRVMADTDQTKLRHMEREREEQILNALQLQIEALQQFQRSTIGDHDAMMQIDLNQTELRHVFDDTIERNSDQERRLLYLEDWIQRSGQMTTELHQLSERLRAERAEATESGRRAEIQRSRHMAEWAEQIKQIKSQIEETVFQGLVPDLKEQQTEGKKRLAAIQEIEERMKQLEPRLLQWQKLVDENRRKERDILLSDVEKRWQQQLGEWQFLRDEWNKKIAALVDRITKLEDWRPDSISSVSALVDRIDKERRERITMVADLVKMFGEFEHAGDKLLADITAQFESERSLLKKRPSADSSTR
jgi:hypothetical protein